MHRHGYKGRKFGRERDQRKALMRSLSIALIEHGSIETTLPKAKELRPFVEKLVSKAKKGDLHNRRLIVNALSSVPASHKLVEQIAPAMQRTSGYLRIVRTELRRGDNTQMASISFVDSIEDTAVVSEEKADKTVETKHDSKEAAIKPAAKTPSAKPSASKASKAAPVAAKRTGRRGDK